MDYFELFSAISLPLGVLILLLLLCRSLVLWYFQIPTMISKQEELIRTMQKQNTLLENLIGKTDTNENEEGEKRDAPSFTELRYGKKE